MEHIHKVFLKLKNFTPEWDWMASPENAVCLKYITEEQNLFTQDLTKISPGWVNPPWFLIPRVLGYLQTFPSQVKVLMVVPHHHRAPWWPLWEKLQDTVMYMALQPQLLFQDPWGTPIPGPPGPLCFCTSTSNPALQALEPTGTQAPQGGPGLVNWPSYTAVYLCLYHNKGASPEDSNRLLASLAKPTLKRYENAWKRFLAFVEHTCLKTELNLTFLSTAPAPHILKLLVQFVENIPLWKMALELQAFMAATSVSQARNCYSALVALPPLQQLKFEVVMKPLKRKFNVSKPRYDIFYDVEPILRDFQLEEKPCDEVSIRLRLILLLRLLCMFRGVDLARAHRNVRKGSLPYFLETQKKGRQYYAWYPMSLDQM
jgi:hypothetical protein